ncbi:YihY/virulence factor BrkB family protein [Faecalibacter rhinopitheci]|uniref:YihY/virulence factor BrkB family protein n=1 Tax=Faecalibacter rhinopitheci TaxID=2779678 RepID=A0A8J7KAD1_9FLAO|nr:YihY/virulence factor BrkB family protein [Faecalibacter rhinopitheci]MBF0597370.1 YihY/virulence factor BrkB family protein [Faecalibacter rhinopitheci]
MDKIKFYFKILKQTIIEFGEDRIMKMSASLTYYALFSLSPLLIIIISSASLFYKKDAIENRMYYELKNIVGPDVALAVQNFVTNSTLSGDSSLALYIGIGVLLFGSTTMFTDMQDSLNLIWRVEAVPKRAWIKFIINRGLSFLVILALGLLLISTVILNSVLVSFGEDILNTISFNMSLNKTSLILINNALSILISVLIFYILFKVLPDAIIKTKPAFIGAIFTAVLFFIAKYLIGIYLSNTRYSTIFGSAGSLVILLLWIYYVATIMYLGAKFTKVYAEFKGFPILPTKNSKLRQVSFIDKLAQTNTKEKDDDNYNV